MTFEEKVKGMSPHDIIMSMVNGLKNRHVKLDMSSFGYHINGVCYGCAATNAICEIAGKVFEDKLIETGLSRSKFLECDLVFLSIFESAINALRQGSLKYCNQHLLELGLGTIVNKKERDLPCLDDNYTNEQLKQYVKLAKDQLPKYQL